MAGIVRVFEDEWKELVEPEDRSLCRLICIPFTWKAENEVSTDKAGQSNESDHMIGCCHFIILDNILIHYNMTYSK